MRKLAFWNTGIGMDDEELKQATDLSSSVNKQMAMDGNFSIGAKVSGLTMSREGIRYRSCKNGIVNEVTIGFDPDEGTYVRFPVELPDGLYATGLPPEKWPMLRVRVSAILGLEGARNGTEEIHAGADYRDVARGRGWAEPG